MYKILALLFAFALISSPINAMASTTAYKVFKLYKKHSGNRPGAPTHGNISCSIESESIIFELPIGSLSGLVTISDLNNEIVLSQYITPDFSSIDITGLSGEYIINVTTDTECEFEGIIYL